MVAGPCLGRGSGIEQHGHVLNVVPHRVHLRRGRRGRRSRSSRRCLKPDTHRGAGVLRQPQAELVTDLRRHEAAAEVVVRPLHSTHST